MRSSPFIAQPTLAVLSPVGGLRRLAPLMRIQDPGLERGWITRARPWTRNDSVRRWTNQQNAAPTPRGGSVRVEHSVAVLLQSLIGGAQP